MPLKTSALVLTKPRTFPLVVSATGFADSCLGAAHILAPVARKVAASEPWPRKDRRLIVAPIPSSKKLFRSEFIKSPPCKPDSRSRLRFTLSRRGARFAPLSVDIHPTRQEIEYGILSELTFILGVTDRCCQ